MITYGLRLVYPINRSQTPSPCRRTPQIRQKRQMISVWIIIHDSYINCCSKSTSPPFKLSTISFSDTALTICRSSGFLPNRDGVLLGVRKLVVPPVDSCTSPRVSRLATTSLNSVLFKGCSIPLSCVHRFEYFT